MPGLRMSGTDRYRLRDLNPVASQVVPNGRLMWTRGRKIIGYGTIDNIAVIPKEATGVMVSIEDHRQIMA